MFQNVAQFDDTLLDAFGFVCSGFLAHAVIHRPVKTIVEVFDSLLEPAAQPNHQRIEMTGAR